MSLDFHICKKGMGPLPWGHVCHAKLMLENAEAPITTVKASPTLPGRHPLCFILASELSLEDL